MYKITVTPQFGDTDGLKHINNNVIGNWFELARNDIFKLFTPDLDVSFENWKLILVRFEIDFIGQIFYGRDVEIATFVEDIGNTSFVIGNEAYQDGELKAKGKAVLVHYDFIEKTKKPIPQDIRKKLEKVKK